MSREPVPSPANPAPAGCCLRRRTEEMRAGFTSAAADERRNYGVTWIHLKNIFKIGELQEDSVVSILEITADGNLQGFLASSTKRDKDD